MPVGFIQSELCYLFTNFGGASYQFGYFVTQNYCCCGCCYELWTFLKPASLFQQINRCVVVCVASDSSDDSERESIPEESVMYSPIKRGKDAPDDKPVRQQVKICISVYVASLVANVVFDHASYWASACFAPEDAHLQDLAICWR
jgi:hypothetical protein